MATVTQQKDLVVGLKKEINMNIGILSKVQAMPSELSLQVFKENALEKPTQALFNHLSYYLVCIIDHAASASLPWPLYDTKAERAYRNELASFISDYSNRGLILPVMSSYLVNPACYKVTMLLFQMSQMAVQKILLSKMNDRQKKLYNDMTEKYKLQKEGFLEHVEKETNSSENKLSNYLQKRKVIEKVAEMMRHKITQMELKLTTLKPQNYIDNLVDGFIAKEKPEKGAIDEILKIKDVSKPAPFFDRWLLETDSQIDKLESKWTEKVSPLLSISKTTQEQTESLIARCTGEADKNTYTIEYNHKTDYIDTRELQKQVNSEQKYILKNIVKDEKLCFPNLIRGFVIATGFVMKNEVVGDEIYKFNEYLEAGRKNYHELVLGMRLVMERVRNAEAKLEPSPVYHHSISVRDIPELPPLPDLSDLRSMRDLQQPALFDTFTPLSLTKHQFNLQRRTSYSFTHTQPQPKSLMNPFTQPSNDFVKSIISCRVSSYDRLNPNVSHNFHNMSVLSKDNLNISAIPRGNQTIAECKSGFTKQQIERLLSTKKSSSSKKFKYKTERPNIQIKRGGLFNESTNSSGESNGLFRSYSSPNLYENKRPTKAEKRKLSIMKEANNSLLEVSGITALDRDSNQSTPTNHADTRATDSLQSTASMPVITVTRSPGIKFNQMLIDYNVEINLNNTMKNEKTETPKNNERLVTKTSSLEKIINRFKKVRASVLPDKSSDIKAIVEEKENIHVDTFTANRVLLPDLLSPSCSVIGKPEDQYLDMMCIDTDDWGTRKPRESLGTALGVDQTFLDQFDLID